MEIIALSGFARVGKDEAAKVLVEEFGFTQVAFADKLREFLYAQDPLVGPTKKNYFTTQRGLPPTTVREVIDEYGWDGYKETAFGEEIRRQLQRLGTEAGRQTLWDTIWIDAAFVNVDSDKVVVSDARFWNEFDAVKERGGSVWRIERAGVGAQSDHLSEVEATYYNGFDARLDNDGTLDEYRDQVRLTYERLVA